LFPGSKTTFTCYANYHDGRTPTKIDNAVWSIEDYNPSYVVNGEYLVWQLGLLRVADEVNEEFDFYLKCKYQNFSRELKVTVLPSTPKRTYQNNSSVVWRIPNYLRDKTLAKEFSQSVIEDAATKLLFEKILGITSIWITKLGGLTLSFLTEMPSANQPSVINFQLIDKNKVSSIINIKTDDKILYQINYLGGVDGDWDEGIVMKVSKQKGESDKYDPKSSFDFVKNLTLLTPSEGRIGLSLGKHLIYPKSPISFSESGVYRLEITSGAKSGNRVCYVQVNSNLEIFEEFITKFFRERTFQKSRIIFPLTCKEISYGESTNSTITSKQWEYDSGVENWKKNITPNPAVDTEIKKNTYIFSIGDGGGSFTRYIFKVKNNIFYLVEIEYYNS
jgi:hypothetical protein